MRKQYKAPFTVSAELHAASLLAASPLTDLNVYADSDDDLSPEDALVKQSSLDNPDGDEWTW